MLPSSWAFVGDVKKISSIAGCAFKKIMCANRGEIAIRVFRAGVELDMRTVRRLSMLSPDARPLSFYFRCAFA